MNILHQKIYRNINISEKYNFMKLRGTPFSCRVGTCSGRVGPYSHRVGPCTCRAGPCSCRVDSCLSGALPCRSGAVLGHPCGCRVDSLSLPCSSAKLPCSSVNIPHGRSPTVDAGKPQSEHGSSRIMVRRGLGLSGTAVLIRAHMGL